MSATIGTLVAGDRVKWLRLYKDILVIYYGTVIEVEVGAETPCAIVQPKGSGEPVQRVEVSSLVGAGESRAPKPNEWDLLLQRSGWLPARSYPARSYPAVSV